MNSRKGRGTLLAGGLLVMALSLGVFLRYDVNISIQKKTASEPVVSVYPESAQTPIHIILPARRASSMRRGTPPVTVAPKPAPPAVKKSSEDSTSAVTNDYRENFVMTYDTGKMTAPASRVHWSTGFRPKPQRLKFEELSNPIKLEPNVAMMIMLELMKTEALASDEARAADPSLGKNFRQIVQARIAFYREGIRNKYSLTHEQLSCLYNQICESPIDRSQLSKRS